MYSLQSASCKGASYSVEEHPKNCWKIAEMFFEKNVDLQKVRLWSVTTSNSRWVRATPNNNCNSPWQFVSTGYEKNRIPF